MIRKENKRELEEREKKELANVESKSSEMLTSFLFRYQRFDRTGEEFEVSVDFL